MTARETMELKGITHERAHYCSHCGSAVNPEAEECPTCGRPLGGTFEARRCRACGALAKATASECGQCRRPLGFQTPEGPGDDLQTMIQRTVDDLNGLVADRREWLDRLERRLEKTRGRLEEIQDSPRDLDHKERARLTVWLEDAEVRRTDALRMAGVLVGVGEAFSTLQAHLHETLSAQGKAEARVVSPTPGGPAEATPVPEANPEQRQKKMEAWWEAQRGVKRDLMSIAKEVEGPVPSDQPGKRQDLGAVIQGLKKIVDELPPGVRKRLQKSGKMEEIERLLQVSASSPTP